MGFILNILDKILGFDDMGSNAPMRENHSPEQPVIRTSFPAEPSDWVRETLEKIDDLAPAILVPR